MKVTPERTSAPPAGKATWKQDPAGVQANILAVALQEFSRNGLSGARIDEIAARTKTSKRMIYYYFGDKEGLYHRVLETAYQKVREGEEALRLDHLDPREAMRQLVGFTFDHHRRNPDFIRLVMIENIHHGKFLRQSEAIGRLNQPAISHIEAVYRRGVESGAFKPGLSPVAIHWHISAVSFFNVSNRASFSLLFGDSLFTDEGQEILKAQAAEMILGLVSRR